MIYLHRSDALFSPVIIDILTGKRCFDIDQGKKMPHKKLKSLDSQRKITDFAFGKHGQAQPNAGLETQNHTVNDTVDNDDSAAEKAGEKTLRLVLVHCYPGQSDWPKQQCRPRTAL